MIDPNETVEGGPLCAGDVRGSMAKESRDPWRHRSQGMRCSSCMWFVAKDGSHGVDDGRGRLGRCRKRAPSDKGFVPVFQADWCGDHRLDESKV